MHKLLPFARTHTHTHTIEALKETTRAFFLLYVSCLWLACLHVLSTLDFYFDCICIICCCCCLNLSAVLHYILKLTKNLYLHRAAVFCYMPFGAVKRKQQQYKIVKTWIEWLLCVLLLLLLLLFVHSEKKKAQQSEKNLFCRDYSIRGARFSKNVRRMWTNIHMLYMYFIHIDIHA